VKTAPQRLARGILIGGAAAAAAAAATLNLVAGVSWVHALALAGLLALLPTVALAQVPLVRGLDVPRLDAYAGSAVTLIVLAVISAVLAGLEGGPGTGFRELPWTTLASWSGGIVAAALLVTLGFRAASLALGLGEDPLLRALIPRTRQEKWAFVGLSLCAGVGEELAYRGYVLGMLVPMVGVWPGVVVTSLVFGVLHAYQGAQGVLRTALLGALMAVAFLQTGSLWPVVVAHVGYDVLAGVFLADALMVPETAGGVEDPEAGSRPA